MQQKEQENRIQLELPDYSLEYEEWIRKKQEANNKEENVVIIDIY